MITQDSLTFYNDVALYDSFGGVVLADEESRKITEHLGNKKAIILQVSVKGADFVEIPFSGATARAVYRQG